MWRERFYHHCSVVISQKLGMNHNIFSQDESLGNGRVPQEVRGDQRHQSGWRRVLHLCGRWLFGQLPVWSLVSHFFSTVRRWRPGMWLTLTRPPLCPVNQTAGGAVPVPSPPSCVSTIVDASQRTAADTASVWTDAVTARKAGRAPAVTPWCVRQPAALMASAPPVSVHCQLWFQIYLVTHGSYEIKTLPISKRLRAKHLCVLLPVLFCVDFHVFLSQVGVSVMLDGEERIAVKVIGNTRIRMSNPD